MPSVTRRPRSTRDERRATVESSLLAATERLVADGHAFTELSVERLIREAGISRSTFYAYFDDKGHLVRRLAVQVMAELEAAAGAWWEVADRADRDALRGAIDEILASYARHEAVYTALLETASYDPQVEAEYRSMMDGFTAAANDVIERGQAVGVMRAELDARDVAGALTWMVERSAHQLLRERADRERLAGALADVIWFTLYR